MSAVFSLADLPNSSFANRRDIVDIGPIILGYVCKWTLGMFIDAAARLRERVHWRSWRTGPDNEYNAAIIALLKFCEVTTPGLIIGDRIIEILESSRADQAAFMAAAATRLSVASKYRITFLAHKVNDLCESESRDPITYIVLSHLGNMLKHLRSRGHPLPIVFATPCVRAIIHCVISDAADAAEAIALLYGAACADVHDVIVTYNARATLRLTFVRICEAELNIAAADVLSVARLLKQWDWEYVHILEWMIDVMVRMREWDKMRAALVRELTLHRVCPQIIEMIRVRKRRKQGTPSRYCLRDVGDAW